MYKEDEVKMKNDTGAMAKVKMKFLLGYNENYLAVENEPFVGGLKFVGGSLVGDFSCWGGWANFWLVGKLSLKKVTLIYFNIENTLF